MVCDQKSEIDLKLLTRLLSETGCLKFGQFTLKSGATSRYYIDLRESTFNPTLFHHIVEAIKQKISHQSSSDSTLDSKKVVVGVPYGVVPIAGAVAYDLKLPYFPVRKEIKEYGNNQGTNLLDGYDFILIEDVMSSGSSIIETIKKLEGKRVTDVIVIVDREAGGEANIKKQYPHMKLHSILKASQILNGSS